MAQERGAVRHRSPARAEQLQRRGAASPWVSTLQESVGTGSFLLLCPSFSSVEELESRFAVPPSMFRPLLIWSHYSSALPKGAVPNTDATPGVTTSVYALSISVCASLTLQFFHVIIKPRNPGAVYKRKHLVSSSLPLLLRAVRWDISTSHCWPSAEPLCTCVPGTSLHTLFSLYTLARHV